ncbi:hypothetical protein [Serratia quinivorans]|uniref:hypothetical protein n=1 Tax=Serratia quinivorans TaxID=137545 RepID=UPI00217C4373|nr:hypothetical protein [Serratia quinivorans]CAI2047224.1 Uncharacterised protein [Serratia quinivorans]CAI2139464.1 Uncharacterised protein [Serratia quinivorans]
MNTFLNDLVTLNQIILLNAREQFPDVEGKKLRYRAAAPMREDDLTAEVCTEIVSGETRYQIATSTDGSSWRMQLDFALNHSIPQIPYVVLSYTRFGSVEEMIFDQVLLTPQENRYQAQLDLYKLEQRDALLQALSDYDAQTTLVVAVKTEHGLTNTVTDPKVFYFAENYYPYIYQGIVPPPPRLQLILTPLQYQQLWYNYYQDYVRKNYLYYLPDTFLLGTNTDGKPMLSISFSASEHATSLGEIKVTFDYFLSPKVNQGRIADATAQFSQMQPDARLAPFANADSLVLQLALPEGKTEEKNALINLQSGIVDSFTLPAQQFALIWDALFDRSPQNLLLKGYLAVQFIGFNPDNLPVILALDAQYQSKVRDFIKQTAPVDIYKTIEFRSDSGAYDPSGPRPIKRILVNIDNQTVELNREHPNHDVTVKVSALDLILNPDKKLIYHYDLQVFYVDGGRTPYDDKTSSFEIIYVP